MHDLSNGKIRINSFISSQACLLNNYKILRFVLCIALKEKEMVDILKLFVILILSILCIDLIIALLYIVPVVLVRRFHTHHNILIANVAFVSLCCAWFYIFAYAIMFQYPTIWNEIIPLCVILEYVTITFNFLLVYSFITVIFNRYLTIVYPLKLFFRTRSWVFVCIGIAWLVGIILGILRLVASLRVNIE